MILPSSSRILATLANLTKTPLANIVAQIADTISNYSKVYNSLGPPMNTSKNLDDENNNSSPIQQKRLTRDAQHVVDFMDKANPQLNLQLINRNFIPGQYISPTSAQPHPIVTYARVLLSCDRLKDVCKLTRILEDCSGIDDSSKCHCYFLLYDNMHDNGVLFEDGWNNNAGGATLANINVGALGRKCALDYLADVVLEAKKNFFPNSSRHRHHKKAATHEMLCVKDAVRRTVLKYLLPRRYSTHEALTIATSLSDAKNIPQLENVAWGTYESTSVAYRILAARSMYSARNECVENNEVPTQVEKEDSEESSHQPRENYSESGDYEVVGIEETGSPVTFETSVIPPEGDDQDMQSKMTSTTPSSSPSAASIPGIQNLGNTCYLSASLQAIFSIPQFIADLYTTYAAQSSSSSTAGKNMPLTKALLEVAAAVGVLTNNDINRSIALSSEMSVTGNTKLLSTRGGSTLDVNPAALKNQMDVLTNDFIG